jgi:hypothetical protein
MTPTEEDLKRDLVKDLTEFERWGRSEPMLSPMVGWYKEAGESAIRRALAAEAEVARLKGVKENKR